MKIFIILIFFVVTNCTIFSQVAINNDGSAPDNSAGLEVKFTNRGFLLPRLTQDQIASIADPADGLQVYCITDGSIYVYVASATLWKEIAYDSGTILPAGGGDNCGDNMLKVHIAGDVAPVNKTVTYGTVANILGEPEKCWITQNLGADNQATAVNDATEPSSGWYWQFNKKQGYKHDGAVRTPNTTWITSIGDNSNWIISNDPCNLLLGDDWRLPTLTEWFNVDHIGGWTNWNGPWNSALKLHAAGIIVNTSGMLNFRGSDGMYWSSNQLSNTNYGQILYLFSVDCYTMNALKAYGLTVRCIK